MGKPRVRILVRGLRAQGVEVEECRFDLWSGIEDKSQVRGVSRWIGISLRLLLAYPVLLYRYLRLGSHDWVLLGYPALLDAFVLAPFARLRRTRIAIDWFLSAYDTIVLDRRMLSPRNPVSRLLRLVEGMLVGLGDMAFMDTATHARRMENLFRLTPGSIGSIPVGAEPEVFPTRSQVKPREPPSPLRVLFYGQFIPLHGIETIVAAARLLRDSPVEWLLVGRGQEAPRIRAMLESRPLPRLRWLEWVGYDELRRYIASADVCLGIFGTSDKAASVIPNKVFQILASGKPLVTRDSSAIRELLAHAPPCVQLVGAGDAVALRDAVIVAGASPVPRCCHAELQQVILPPIIGASLVAQLAQAPRSRNA